MMSRSLRLRDCDVHNADGVRMVERVHAFLAARGIPLASNQINLSLMYRQVRCCASPRTLP